MNARAVEEAQARLRELQLQGWEDFAVAGAAFGGALAGTWLVPEAVAPLLASGVGLSILGARALVRRYLLLEELAADPDAYTIGDVRKLALEAATPEHRRALAVSLRHALAVPSERVASNRDLLEELVAALEDERLSLDPAAAVALDRILTDGQTRRLYDSSFPADELRSRLRRVLDGFGERQAA